MLLKQVRVEVHLIAESRKFGDSKCMFGSFELGQTESPIYDSKKTTDDTREINWWNGL